MEPIKGASALNLPRWVLLSSLTLHWVMILFHFTVEVNSEKGGEFCKKVWAEAHLPFNQ